MQSITFDTFLTSALLKFDKLDRFDIAYLINELKSNGILVIEDGKLDNIRFYITAKDNCIMLDECLSLNTEVDYHITLENYLKKHENKIVRDFFNSLDIKEFVLSKIEKLGIIDENQLKKVFNTRQEYEFKLLEKEDYIKTKHNKTKQYILSQKGKMLLFKKNNKKELNEFKENLIKEGYNDSLLDDFLMRLDLNINLLTINNFLEYCSMYNKNPYRTKKEKINYERLKTVPYTMLDDKGKKRMQDMLSVWDDEHCIHITNPNNLFNNINVTNEIEYIDWDNIDTEKMFNKKDYQTFILPSIQDAFLYIQNKLGKEIINELKNGNENACSFLAVIEKYPINNENYYIIRGIIKGDKDGYSLAFNPEYEKAIPKSTWEKSSRFSGSITPVPYTLKRRVNRND